MEAYYPIMMNVSNRRCVVVGGGRVAERKIAALLECKAAVVVISPTFTPQIEKWIHETQLKGIARKYHSSDADNAILLIAATNDAEVNRHVYLDAQSRNVPVNVADQTGLSDFIVPAVVRRGKLVIAISTSGASPSAARIIKKEIETAFGQEYEIYLDFLSEYRLKVQEKVNDTNHRQRLYKEMMETDIIQIIRNGKFDSFRKTFFQQIEELL